MTESLRPSLAVVSDDFNTLHALEEAERLPHIPIHASVIVTDESSVRPFVKKYRQRLEKFEPGVHINFFEGNFLSDRHVLFGESGRLHTALHRIEHVRRNIPVVSSLYDWFYTADLAKFIPDIKDEQNRQIDEGYRLFGRVPYVTYHFGMHFSSLLNRLFEEVASERGIPYRRADHYAAAPARKTAHLSFLDDVNFPGVTPEIMHTTLKYAHQKRKPAELCVHLGGAYGYEQVHALRDARVSTMLTNFTLAMPHDIINSING